MSEIEWKMCPRCERTLEPGEKICSYCGCDVEAAEKDGYVESMYESGTLARGSKPLIDWNRTKTREARMKIIAVSFVAIACFLVLGMFLR